jgi:hypothetical protein
MTNENSDPALPEGKPRALNILICVPALGDCASGFALSLARAMAHFASLPYAGDKKVDVTFCTSANLAESRTRLVARGYELEASHILWLDTDMKFPADTITRLLNHNLAVVGANYPTKEMEARPTAYADDEDYTGPVWTGENSTGLKQVAHCGMGVLLTDMGVFDALSPPFFAFEPQPPDFIKQTSETAGFCARLGQAGIAVHIDHDLSKQVAHIGSFEFSNFLAREAEVVKQALYRDLP